MKNEDKKDFNILMDKIYTKLLKHPIKISRDKIKDVNTKVIEECEKNYAHILLISIIAMASDLDDFKSDLNEVLKITANRIKTNSNQEAISFNIIEQYLRMICNNNDIIFNKDEIKYENTNTIDSFCLDKTSMFLAKFFLSDSKKKSL